MIVSGRRFVPVQVPVLPAGMAVGVGVKLTPAPPDQHPQRERHDHNPHGDLGALIVRADPDMHAVEIEISPDGVDDQRSHKEVLERSINGHPAFSAVFDGLRAGTYTLWVDDEARARGVKVEGGHVGQLDWRHVHVRT